MDKRLDLNVDMAFNFLNFLKAGFTTKHDPRQALILPELYRLPVNGRLLGAEMDLQFGYNALRRFDDHRVSDDNRCDPRLVQIAQIRLNALQILVMGINIRGDEHLCAVFFSKFHAFPHFFETKIIRIGTKAIMLSPDIYGVGAVMDGEFQLFEITRRGEQFGFRQPVTFSHIFRDMLLRGLHLRSPLIILLVNKFFGT
ncbi:hypothetical protein D3C81_1001570 [compost metagenome]